MLHDCLLELCCLKKPDFFSFFGSLIFFFFFFSWKLLEFSLSLEWEMLVKCLQVRVFRVFFLNLVWWELLIWKVTSFCSVDLLLLFLIISLFSNDRTLLLELLSDTRQTAWILSFLLSCPIFKFLFLFLFYILWEILTLPLKSSTCSSVFPTIPSVFCFFTGDHRFN